MDRNSIIKNLSIKNSMCHILTILLAKRNIKVWKVHLGWFYIFFSYITESEVIRVHSPAGLSPSMCKSSDIEDDNQREIEEDFRLLNYIFSNNIIGQIHRYTPRMTFHFIQNLGATLLHYLSLVRYLPRDEE